MQHMHCIDLILCFTFAIYMQLQLMLTLLLVKHKFIP
jgi:hypothetical protein